MARGIVRAGSRDLLAQGGDPGVAGESEEQQAGGLEDPAPPAGQHGPEVVGRPRPAAERRHHHDRQDGEHERHQHPGQPGRLLHAPQVHGGQRHDGGDGQRAAPVGRGVRAEGQGHRGAARGLADDEPPAGQVAPERAEALAPVDVGAARARVPRRQAGRRRGVAVGDDGGHHQAHEQPAAGRGRRRADGGEHTGADHRAQPDDDRVPQPEPPRQPRGRVACGTRLPRRGPAAVGTRTARLPRLRSGAVHAPRG